MDARDRRLIFAAALLRSLGIGMIPILLAGYVKSAGGGDWEIGVVSAAGLAGGALATLLTGLWADRVGRRRFALLLGGAGAAGGALLAVSDHVALWAVGAFVGMVNAMGRDRGAAMTLEQAALPATTTDQTRTRAFAWYNMMLGIGQALGSLLAGAPDRLKDRLALDEPTLMRWAMLGPAALTLVSMAAYLFLSGRVEVPAPARRLSPEGRRIAAKLSGLSCIDSVGGGFVVSTLISWYFFERFGASGAQLGALFAAGSVLQAVSYHVASGLARRIGLVNTMVFTHIPASLALMAVPLAPALGAAAALWLLREFLNQMDVPTRQSYTAAIVARDELTLVSGIVNLARQSSQSVGALLAGVASTALAQSAPLLLGGGLKIVYDLSLWISFRRLKPPEERDLPV
jgi:MFS family permease